MSTTLAEVDAQLGGYAPLPRANGELVFDEVWHGRALGMGVVVLERLGLPWADFREHLVGAIERHGHPRGRDGRRGLLRRVPRRDRVAGRRALLAPSRPAAATCEHAAMLGVLLALSASLMWGVADYVGGLLTRSREVFSIVLVSQLAGLVVIACVVAGRGVGWPGAEAMLPAALAGVLGAFTIVVFYLALSYGPVSIVAPIMAASAAIPVVYGLVTGERPSPLQLAGLARHARGRDPRLADDGRRARARPARDRVRHPRGA